MGRGGWVLAVAVWCSSCVWHRIEPAAVEPPSRHRLSLGLAPADNQTSLEDLQKISVALTRWGAVSAIQFPWREGDAIDVVATLKLRQTAELHGARNIFVAGAVGASLFALSCCLGPKISEVHVVEASFMGADGTALGTHTEIFTSTLEMGMGADPLRAAKALDDRQLEQIAARLIDWWGEDQARIRRETPRGPVRR